MKHKAKRLFSAMLASIMALLLVVSVFTPSAYAVDDREEHRNYRKYKTTIELTGREVEEQYELSSKNLYLFSLEGAAPGDEWYGSVKVENRTETDMAICVQSIESTLEQDTVLFDLLDLRISVAGKSASRGKYGEGGKPVTDYYLLSPGEVMYFDIKVSLSDTVGNEVQGRQMDSTWTFKAVFFEPEQLILDYDVYYMTQYFEDLLPSKLGHGYPNEIITEYAPIIDGFLPDEQAKQLLLQENGRNVIYFIYYPEEGESTPAAPIDPSNPSEPSVTPNPPDDTIPFDPKDDIINTGLDMTESNTVYFTYALALILAVFAVVLTTVSIRRSKQSHLSGTFCNDETHEDSYEEDD